MAGTAAGPPGSPPGGPGSVYAPGGKGNPPRRVAEWVAHQQHDLGAHWRRRKESEPADRQTWAALLAHLDDEGGTDDEEEESTPASRTLRAFQALRDDNTFQPAMYEQVRNVFMVNGRPVILIVLTHTREALEAKMPYLTAACSPVPVLLAWGRSAAAPPKCTPHVAIWYWFMDLSCNDGCGCMCRVWTPHPR